MNVCMCKCLYVRVCAHVCCARECCALVNICICKHTLA